MRPYFQQALEANGVSAWLRPLFVANEWLGGNVDVTGLLSGADIARAIGMSERAMASASGASLRVYAIPDVVLNDDGITLDDHDIACVARAAAEVAGDDSLADRVFLCASNPIDYIPQVRERLGRER